MILAKILLLSWTSSPRNIRPLDLHYSTRNVPRVSGIAGKKGCGNFEDLFPGGGKGGLSKLGDVIRKSWPYNFSEVTVFGFCFANITKGYQESHVNHPSQEKLGTSPSMDSVHRHPCGFLKVLNMHHPERIRNFFFSEFWPCWISQMTSFRTKYSAKYEGGGESSQIRSQKGGEKSWDSCSSLRL